MTINDIYKEAETQGTKTIILLIEYLVYERKVLQMDDDYTKLDYYTQPKFRKKMLEYLETYEVRRNERKQAI